MYSVFCKRNLAIIFGKLHINIFNSQNLIRLILARNCRLTNDVQPVRKAMAIGYISTADFRDDEMSVTLVLPTSSPYITLFKTARRTTDARNRDSLFRARVAR